MRGIDVSSHNGGIDYNQVKASGIDFVMVRAGYGYGYEDERFSQNVERAKASGLHVGAYWFIYALNEEQAKANADVFVGLLERYKGTFDMPVACDFEYDSERYMRDSGVTPTRALNTAIIDAFCKRMEQYGYYVSNYLNPDYIQSRVNFSDVSQYDLWLAQWGTSAPSYECGMWQYSSDGSVAGVSGRVDVNIANIDYPTLIKSKGFNHTNLSDTAPAPQIAPAVTPSDTFSVGDKVIVTNPVDINGTPLAVNGTYEIIEVSNANRIVIGRGGVVTAAMPPSHIKRTSEGSAGLTAIEVAHQIWYGYGQDWGTGSDRARRVAAAGIDYNEVQAELAKYYN